MKSTKSQNTEGTGVHAAAMLLEGWINKLKVKFEMWRTLWTSQMRCHHQLNSAAAKQIKCSGSILGLSHTYKNNTFQRLQRWTVDCCLEAGKLIASIAVRGRARRAYASWLSASKKTLIPPTDSHRLSTFIWPLWRTSADKAAEVFKEKDRKKNTTWICVMSLLADENFISTPSVGGSSHPTVMMKHHQSQSWCAEKG